MIFSHSCQYAIKSCIYLAIKKDKTEVAEISEYINSPVAFTSKILQRLAKKNIISSSKGRSGGFYLNEQQQQELSIEDIYLAIDGEQNLNNCVLGISICSEERPCPVHHLAKGIRKQLQNILSQKIKDIQDIGEIKFD